jgi:N6-adenosine-specific RNA methylase IME4
VIVVDVAWPTAIRAEDPSRQSNLPYPEMSIEEICKLPVGALAAPDCILWFWVTNFYMRKAYDALDAYGFKAKTILTWDKGQMGVGDLLRGQTEHCIMAMRGRPVVALTNQTTLLRAPARDHSRKPDEFYAMVESLCPAPRYVSLFHRGPAPSNCWDCHGDEATSGKMAA